MNPADLDESDVGENPFARSCIVCGDPLTPNDPDAMCLGLIVYAHVYCVCCEICGARLDEHGDCPTPQEHEPKDRPVKAAACLETDRDIDW